MMTQDTIQDPPPDAHLRDCIEGFSDLEGKIMISRVYGQTQAEREEDHKNGKCGAWCSICEYEAWAWYDTLPKDENGKAMFPET